jgi:predicted TIM-barrel fold metal-dependent hydrolase
MTKQDVPMIVSVDDHVVEPPHLFERWLPRKFQDDAPKSEHRFVSAASGLVDGFVEDPDGLPASCWFFGSSVYVYRRPSVVMKDLTTSPDWRTNEPVPYDQMRPGCYEPKARVQEMLSNHVDGSLCFPSFPRFCGQVFTEQSENDRALGLACIQAYNDWMVEEWCGESDGHLIPLCVVPLWDPQLAAQEIRRNAARGVRAVTFSELIGRLGHPGLHTDYWDPFFAACEETGTVVCMHIGSSSSGVAPPPGAPVVVGLTLTFVNSYLSLVDYVFSGILDRYPKLKLAYSEGQVGWVPYCLERMDHVFHSHTWAHGDYKPKLPPSSYFRQNVYGCFFSDRHGAENAEKIGVDNLTFETDFPHADGSYPNTLEHARRQFAGIDPEVTYKIVRGNAIRIFELDLDRDLTPAG